MDISAYFEMVYDMDKFELSRSFPMVADGSCRTVYAITRDLVAKVATNRDGVRQCRKENIVFSHADEYLRTYLCPVLWHAPGMIVMARAVPVMPLDMVAGDLHVDLSITGRGYRAYEDLKFLSRKFDLLFDDLISVTSWGYLGNRAVLVDYGCKS